MSRILLTIVLILNVLQSIQGLTRPLVIGHRGTAYLPELTLATQSMAHAFGADIIEIDVCLSRDDQLIVIHGKHSTRTKIGIFFDFLYRSLFGCSK
jgi:glycerophosphoryl diester phosphodiesterase